MERIDCIPENLVQTIEFVNVETIIDIVIERNPFSNTVSRYRIYYKDA